MLPVPSQHSMRLRGGLVAGCHVECPSNMYEVCEPLVDRGLGPAPRTLMFIRFCRRSNQNGAPSEIAKPVTSQPAREKTQADGSLRCKSSCVQPNGTGKSCTRLIASDRLGEAPPDTSACEAMKLCACTAIAARVS